MKLLTLILITLVCFASAKPGVRHLEEGEVTIEREFNDDGELPEGREIVVDSDHPIRVPPELKAKGLQQDDDHDRALTYRYPSCYRCWWSWFYGWVTYCCNYGYCTYYYC